MGDELIFYNLFYCFNYWSNAEVGIELADLDSCFLEDACKTSSLQQRVRRPICSKKLRWTSYVDVAGPATIGQHLWPEKQHACNSISPDWWRCSHAETHPSCLLCFGVLQLVLRFLFPQKCDCLWLRPKLLLDKENQQFLENQPSLKGICVASDWIVWNETRLKCQNLTDPPAPQLFHN